MKLPSQNIFDFAHFLLHGIIHHVMIELSLKQLNLLLTLQMSSQLSSKLIRDIVKDAKELERFNQFLQETIGEISWPPPPKMENVEDIRRWIFCGCPSPWTERTLLHRFNIWKKEVRTQAIYDLNPVLCI
jgi:hypothetical protein